MQTTNRKDSMMRGYLRYCMVVCAVLAWASAFAWLDGDSFYPRLAYEEWLTAMDKETLLDDMASNNDILVIDGVEYLTAYSPLELIRGKQRYHDMYEGLIMTMNGGLSFAAFWGDGAIRCKRLWECRLEVSDDSLFLMDIKSLQFHGTSVVWSKEERRERQVAPVNQDSINQRMEEFTDCRFVHGCMHLPIVSGTVFAKKRNLAPRPEVWDVANQKPEDMRVYLRWVDEPVYRIVFDEGRMVSMEVMSEPITAEEHRAFVWRTAAIAVGVVLLVAIVFVLRDYRRKRKYLNMYKALQKNQTQLIIANEQSDEEPEKRPLTRDEVMALYRDNFVICREQFASSGWIQRLEKMNATLHADTLMLGGEERQRLSKVLDECFIQVNVNLRAEGRLTNDDVRCCLLSMLGCSLQVVAACLGCSHEAVQTRKSRLKDKLPKDVFEWVFVKK